MCRGQILINFWLKCFWVICTNILFFYFSLFFWWVYQVSHPVNSWCDLLCSSIGKALTVSYSWHFLKSMTTMCDLSDRCCLYADCGGSFLFSLQWHLEMSKFWGSSFLCRFIWHPRVLSPPLVSCHPSHLLFLLLSVIICGGSCLVIWPLTVRGTDSRCPPFTHQACLYIQMHCSEERCNFKLDLHAQPHAHSHLRRRARAGERGMGRMT